MANRFGVDVYDGLAIIGFGALEYGVALWSHPAAWIVGGVILCSASLWPLRRKRHP